MHSIYVHVAGVQYGKDEAARREAERTKRHKEWCDTLHGVDMVLRAGECEP